MDYSELSDGQVSRKLAEALGYKSDSVNDTGPIAVYKTHPARWQYADYCNSWADMGPLLAEHKVSLSWFSKKHQWCASSPDRFMNFVIHNNPLRAAAICLLIMLEGE